jgi:hypothetical protein
MNVRSPAACEFLQRSSEGCVSRAARGFVQFSGFWLPELTFAQVLKAAIAFRLT